MKKKNVGEVETLHGQLDGVTCNIFSLKEPEYTMKIMSTYGAAVEDTKYRQNTRTYLKVQALKKLGLLVIG